MDLGLHTERRMTRIIAYCLRAFFYAWQKTGAQKKRAHVSSLGSGFGAGRAIAASELRSVGSNVGGQNKKTRKAFSDAGFLGICGGSGEIRTHECLATLPVFKTGAFNHSATLPMISWWAILGSNQ
jgi:hypothetical protein